MFRFTVALIFCNLVSGQRLALPSYISRCSLSDPNLNECIRDRANAAIPIIARGDESFGIPPVSPLVIPEGLMVCSGLSLLVTNVTTDDLKDLRITKAVLNDDNLELSASLDRINVIAQNYTVLSGRFNDVPAQGHGIFNMTLVNATINYKANLRSYKKRGESYFELRRPVVSANFDRGYYYFENLRSSEQGDMNAYINDNWEMFGEQLTPAIETYLMTFIHYPLNEVLARVPLNELFLE